MTECWLPDLCRRSRILAMVGMAELVVVLLMVAPGNSQEFGFGVFLSASAFSMWLALAVSLLLCLSRRHLSGFRPAVSVLLALALTAVMTSAAATVVYALYDAIGEPPVEAALWRFALASAATSTLIAALALRYFYVSDRWVAQLNANARAEADALQARIRPHFLFNSMNMIASLVRKDPAVAEQAVLDLSDLFRAALGAGEGGSTLEQEVELVRHYLSIESLRLGDRLQVEWGLGEPLPWTLQLPRLALQPLVENAVLHGISRLEGGGVVSIDMRAEDGLLHICIRNPVPAENAQISALHAGGGHAQRNIAYRLAHAFGPRAKMAGRQEGGMYRCELTLPLV
jgi:two-component system, LytTR family, sensor histidine kinase AlgZ